MGSFRRFAMLCIVLAFFGTTVRGGVAPVLAAPAGGSVSKTKQLPGFGKFRVIRIDSEGVFPRTLRVESGATVVWFNASVRYTSVVFNNGKILNQVTRAPTHFYLAPDGAYVSTAFGSGGTASTAFVKPGTYTYFVTGALDGYFAHIVVN